MDKFKQTLINIDSDDLTNEQVVSILILVVGKIEIDTVSGMARKEGKTPRGINLSNQYRKIMIGCQKMAIKGLTNTKLPF